MVSDMLLVKIQIHCKHVRTEDGGVIARIKLREVDENWINLSSKMVERRRSSIRQQQLGDYAIDFDHASLYFKSHLSMSATCSRVVSRYKDELLGV
jgi:hypothetical protein